MKRWQDRGEVADSDDEALASSDESQSPAHKRPKVNASNHPVAPAPAPGSPIDDDPDKDWLRPATTTTTTYSRRAKAVRPNPIKTSSDPAPSRDVSSEHHYAAPERASPTELDANDAGPVDSTHRTTESDDSEVLPNPSQLLATGAREGATRCAPTDGDLSSGLSSPLSERATSPPPAFQFPRLFGGNIAPRQQETENLSPSDPSQDAEHESNVAAIAAVVQADEASNAGPGRRTLRARTEKQLHPYVYDKTIYQQQWRQRGLRPVHFNVADKRATETQDQSYSGDESEIQHVSSPGRGSSELGDSSLGRPQPAHTDINAMSRGHVHSESEEDFPDIDAVLSRDLPGGVQAGWKRRKLSHPSRTGRMRDAVTTATAPATLTLQDELSIPPSPPPTSSDTVYGLPAQPAVPGFKMPYGMTPAALPTPQISSDAPPARNAEFGAISETESLPRRSRTSTISRMHPRPQPIVDSSTESGTNSESEPSVDEEVNDRRLRRVQKRIRGVLPASWLKIDLRARQREASLLSPRRRRPSTASPPPTGRPPKGVAQRVSRSSVTPARGMHIVISDDKDSEEERFAESPRPLRQQALIRTRGTSTAWQLEPADDEQMEVDWIDPMLAGTSRRDLRRRSKKRQPRITDAFRKAPKGHSDFSEERTGLERRVRSTASGRPPGARKFPKATRSHQAAPRLSILDGPSAAVNGQEVLPQFVRLARRQARRDRTWGRHSPSRKVIRLATVEDTEDATALLSAWREGTIAPQELHQHQHQHEPTQGGAVQDHGMPALRKPLADIPINRQQHLPEPLRKTLKSNRSRQDTRTSPHTPRPQQHRLRDGVVPGVEGVELRNQRPSMTQAPPARRSTHGHTQTSRYRGAQLESLELAFGEDHRSAIFERRINCLTENVARPGQPHASRDHQLQRFIDGPDELPRPATASGQYLVRAADKQDKQEKPENQEYTTHQPRVVHRPRKRIPRYIDAEARHFRQPSEPLSASVETLEVTNAGKHLPGATLKGLGGFGTRYAVDFDIDPLPHGTYFHQSTFVGSGDLAASLDIAKRDFARVVGRLRVHVNGDVLEWGAWTEEVAAGLTSIPRAIADAARLLEEASDERLLEEQHAVVTSNVDHMLRSVIRYCSKCLTFLDPVDRRHCIQHLHRFVEELLEVVASADVHRGFNHQLRTRIYQYALVVATQTHQLSEAPLLEPDTARNIQGVVIATSGVLAKHIVDVGQDELRQCYEDSRQVSKREAGIRSDDSAVSAFVVLHHCLDVALPGQLVFWTAVNEALDIQYSAVDSVSIMDKAWSSIVSILPLLEIDKAGIVRPGSRMHSNQQNWSAVKALTERMLELYTATSSVPGSTINDYLRVILIRNYRLITRWGWWSCETLLGTVFDFFARRGLEQLYLEEAKGSPRFLAELEAHPAIELEPGDCSFHIFLKALASGLQAMRKHGDYSDRKIGGIVWRFIPNHGRMHRKDSDVRQTDLDALRNHHDLLCVLYFASAPGHRPRLDLLRNLVDHSISHREACRLNIRSWINLVSFQASTDEPAEELQSFADWYREMSRTTMSQFRLAKTEAEHDFAIAKTQGQIGITESLLISTIASNQRLIAATLVDALAGLKRALRGSSSLAAATVLIRDTAFWTAFVPFDAYERRLYSALNEALEVIKTALDVERKLKPQAESQQTSEESQEYGDLSALHELAAAENAGPEVSPTISDLLQEPVGQLLSNVFGADVAVDDASLSKIVEVWTTLAEESVNSGKRSWSSFVDEHSPHSWHRLRDTEHKRKFTPYFMASVVDHLGDRFRCVESEVFTAWLVSLVAREAMLKHQHLLTMALLQHADDQPLLYNLPFSKNHRIGRFSTTLQELRQRRLALISSVLSNMRDNFDETLRHQPQRLQELRKCYANMLRHVMNAMKSNYQELQDSTAGQIADANAQGAYVEFVQYIVSFLQQHTTDICRIDPFFTDSSAFPLPATDPTYVIGRLRSYVPRLAEGGVRKQLAVFVHAVSERAAVDNQQQYLADQLYTSMSGMLERGSSQAPSLRQVLLIAILPAYVEAALSTACSWILAVPILESCARIVPDLLYCMKTENVDTITAVTGILKAVLRSLIHAVAPALLHPGLLRLPHVQRVVALVLNVGLSILTLTRFIHQLQSSAGDLLDEIETLRMATVEIETALSGSTSFCPVSLRQTSIAADEAWADTKSFAQSQVREAFAGGWYAEDGQYYVRRGNTSREVVVRLDDEACQEQMLAAIGSFRTSFAAVIVDGRGGGQPDTAPDSCGVGGLLI